MQVGKLVYMRQKLLLTINSLRSGGAERVVSQLLNHLQNDFEIHLALYNKVIEYDIPADIQIIDLKQSESDNQFLTLIKLPLLSYRLSRYCRKHTITHSVAFLNRPCYINALMKNWWGYKGRIVMCERTHQSTMLQTKSWLNKWITKFLVKYSYRNANLVLANSQAMKKDLEETLGVTSPVQVIYNPIDIQELQVKMKEPISMSLDPAIFYFVSVGNFRKEKNYPLLLEAFAGIKDPKCKLLLVGGGYMERELKQKVKALGITDAVVFCGKDNNPFKYMQRCDCFVMCSDVEGFPNVLLEAVACGKPVISTDCKSGPRELLAPATDIFFQLEDHYSIEEYGVLTPVGNAAVLTAAMKKMMQDESLRQQLQQKAAARGAAFDVNLIKQDFVKAFLG